MTIRQRLAHWISGRSDGQTAAATDKDCAETIVRAHRELVERAELAEGELRKLMSAYLGAEPPAAMRPDAETILRVLSMRGGGVQG